MKKIRYVQRVKSKDGPPRLYFRKDGYRYALTSPDGSEALEREVAAHLSRLEQIKKAQKPKAGTLSGALSTYAHSAEFLMLASRTQQDYDRYIRDLDNDLGFLMLADIDYSLLKGLQDQMAQRGFKSANDRMQVLKNALKPAIHDGRIEKDPFLHLQKVKRPHDLADTNHAWEDSEVAAVVALALKRGQAGLARAVALGRWAGFRKETICSIKLNARISGMDGNGVPTHRLSWVTEKRKVPVDIREDHRLTDLLEQTPNKALTIAYNKDGLPWKPRALNQAMDRILKPLVESGKVRPGLTIHGLRHARGVELALSGASDAEIMSQLGHSSTHAAQIYRREASRRSLADKAQDRIDNVVSIRQDKQKLAVK